MKLLIIAGMTLAFGQAAYACNTELLAVTEWNAEATNIASLPAKLSAEVTYEGERSFRMIHAGVMLDDVLGRRLAQSNLAEDASASNGDVIVADRIVSANERLLTINRDDVVARTCVWSIVYDDGTIEKFD